MNGIGIACIDSVLKGRVVVCSRQRSKNVETGDLSTEAGGGATVVQKSAEEDGWLGGHKKTTPRTDKLEKVNSHVRILYIHCPWRASEPFRVTMAPPSTSDGNSPVSTLQISGFSNHRLPPLSVAVKAQDLPSIYRLFRLILCRGNEVTGSQNCWDNRSDMDFTVSVRALQKHRGLHRARCVLCMRRYVPDWLRPPWEAP